MKKIVFFILVLVLILCLPLAACSNTQEEQAGVGATIENSSEGEVNGGSTADQDAVSDAELTLYPAYLILPLSQHITLEAAAKGGGAFVWSSSDPTVATVDENGRITPLSEGETFITVALADDESVTAVCSVLVSADGNIFLWEE